MTWTMDGQPGLCCLTADGHIGVELDQEGAFLTYNDEVPHAWWCLWCGTGVSNERDPSTVGCPGCECVAGVRICAHHGGQHILGKGPNRIQLCDAYGYEPTNRDGASPPPPEPDRGYW